MKLTNFFNKSRSLRYAGWTLVLLLPSCFAQGPKLTVSEPQKVTLKRGSSATVKITAALNEGFHANSHTPSDENLIPLTLNWTPGVAVAKDVVYPKPKMEKYSFSDKPLSVVTGSFDLTTTFAVPASAPAGDGFLTGKLRYQACNDKACFPPKNVEVKVPVTVQ